jgi:hypothetical protein
MRIGMTCLLASLVGCSGGTTTASVQPSTTSASADEGTMCEADCDGDTIEWLMFHDIQGLHGGTALYVSGDSVVAVVATPGESGLVEQRFEAALTPADRLAIDTWLGEVNFWQMSVASRPGVPDEARSVVAARSSDGTQHQVAAWDGQRDHAAFWRLASHLRGRARAMVNGAPAYEGSLDYAWRPTGTAWPALY